MWLLILLVLFVTPAHAKRFDEQSVVCRSVQLFRDEDGKPFAIAECQSFDADGHAIRTFNRDLLPLMTGAQKTCLGNAINSALTLVRQAEGIPTPTPSPSATSATPTATPVPTAHP